MSKTIIAVRHFGLGGRESLETAVTFILRKCILDYIGTQEAYLSMLLAK